MKERYNKRIQKKELEKREKRERKKSYRRQKGEYREMEKIQIQGEKMKEMRTGGQIDRYIANQADGQK